MGGGCEGEVIRTLTVCSVLGCRGIPQTIEALDSHGLRRGMRLLSYVWLQSCLPSSVVCRGALGCSISSSFNMIIGTFVLISVFLISFC